MKTQTIFEAYNGCKHELENAGIEDYVFESKQIIKHVTGYTGAQILVKYTESLTEFQQNNLTAIIKQRLHRYPLQYIFCKWNFFGHEFYVGPGVLIPRQDTETVIDVCLEFLKGKKSPKILDLCAGSGCIGITLAAECENSDVTLVEKYDEALTYTQKNIDYNSVSAKAVKGDIFESVASDEKYDLIVSNPPYIKADDMEKLQPEVEFEPDTALYGGEDGLMFYRAIIENYKHSLTAGGMLCFEAGIDEAPAITLLLKSAGFDGIDIREDASGIARVVFGTAKDL